VNGYREVGATGRYRDRPIGTDDMQEKHAAGRTGGEDKQHSCIHDLLPSACKVCNGDVRRLVEEGMSEKFARAEVFGERL